MSLAGLSWRDWEKEQLLVEESSLLAWWRDLVMVKTPGQLDRIIQGAGYLESNYTVNED